MGIDNIWVFAQEANGAPTPATLELLTKARSLGGTVSAFVVGDGAPIASALGEYGAAKVYSTGALDGDLPGAAGAAAMKAVIDGGDSPDLIMFPQNYEGRDIVSRLSVKLDRTVLTNNTQIEVDGDVRPTGGSAAGPWTFVWLQMSDLDRIRNGNTMILDIHRASLDFQLRGTAAAITKIEECVTQGRRGGMYATNRPSPMPPLPGGKQSSRAGLPVPNCPDGGPTLPVTGICQGQASDYLLNTSNPNDYLLPDPSCDWVVNETHMIDGVLLYKALRCKGITTQLEYGGGAHYATLDITRSALWADNGGTPQGETRVVWITHVDPSNPIPNLLRASRDGMDQPMPGVKCVLKRKDNGDGWVYAPDAATMAAQDGPTPPMCGSFSEGDGVDRWWRVVADFGMLIDLPGEAYQDFDPSSLTLLRKSPAGDWQVAY